MFLPNNLSNYAVGKISLDKGGRAVVIKQLPIATAKICLYNFDFSSYCGEICIRFYNGWADMGTVNVLKFNRQSLAELLHNRKEYSFVCGTTCNYLCVERYGNEEGEVEFDYTFFN